MPGEYPVSGMTTFGSRIGARNVAGRANWSEEYVENPAVGMVNTVPQSQHPHDGRIRQIPVFARTRSGEWVPVAMATYDGECRIVGYDTSLLDRLVEAGRMPEDQRVRSFIDRYRVLIGNLDTMPTQREYPVQSPHYSWLSLRPGEVEVVG